VKNEDEVTWDVAPFMDDEPIGRLAQRALDTKKVTLPDGTYIEKVDGGFSLYNRTGKEIGKYQGDTKEVARTVAAATLNASAQSRHPDSVGGKRRYMSFGKLKEGKPMEGRARR
jgi:hypothetical protein